MSKMLPQSGGMGQELYPSIRKYLDEQIEHLGMTVSAYARPDGISSFPTTF